MSTLAPTLQAFFTDRLIHQRDSSPRTIKAYRDTFRLLLRFIAEQTGQLPFQLDLADIDAPMIGALLNAPDRATWRGRRDHALILTAITTGVRVAELIALTVGNVTTSPTGHIRVLGKGRKNRTTPLKAETATVLADWLHERQGDPDDPVFPTRQGRALSQDAITKLLTKHTTAAASECPSLAGKRVTPHILRHTNAMLLQAEHVDIATIALWLGHESVKTTYIYQHADQDIKQEAIDRTATIGTPPGRYQPPDTLLAFLDSLTIIPTSRPPQPPQEQGKQRRQPPKSG